LWKANASDSDPRLQLQRVVKQGRGELKSAECQQKCPPVFNLPGTGIGFGAGVTGFETVSLSRAAVPFYGKSSGYGQIQSSNLRCREPGGIKFAYYKCASLSMACCGATVFCT
jgi:hypothetical protein